MFEGRALPDRGELPSWHTRRRTNKGRTCLCRRIRQTSADRRAESGPGDTRVRLPRTTGTGASNSTQKKSERRRKGGEITGARGRGGISEVGCASLVIGIDCERRTGGVRGEARSATKTGLPSGCRSHGASGGGRLRNGIASRHQVEGPHIAHAQRYAQHLRHVGLVPRTVGRCGAENRSPGGREIMAVRWRKLE